MPCWSALVLALLVAGFALGSPNVWWNGLNVPWDNFGMDIGTSERYNSTWFGSFYQQTEANHINSVRFWVHCDGRGSPLFYSDGAVKGLSSTFLTDLQRAAKQAENANAVLLVTLFSFDMCNEETSAGTHISLISDEAFTRSYLIKALRPMVQSLNDSKNVVWEVINEPEWCIKETPASTLHSVRLSQMQRFVSLITNEIHAHSSHKVTVGSASLKWNSDVLPAVGNWWKDTSLQYGASLDFYQSRFKPPKAGSPSKEAD